MTMPLSIDVSLRCRHQMSLLGRSLLGDEVRQLCSVASFPLARRLVVACGTETRRARGLRRCSKRDWRAFSQAARGVLSEDASTAPPWRTMFFGTDHFALEHLKLLNLNRLKGDPKVVSTLDVVVSSDKCPVALYAKRHGLTLKRWPLKRAYDYDVGAVVSFGHLVPASLIDSFPYGIVNVHASLLPQWRGASPIMHTILNGDEHTGISIIEIRPHHFDIGPLLMQSRYPIPDGCTAAQLSTFLADQGAHMLLETFHNLLTLERREHEQDDSGITYAHKLSTMNARINWESQNADSIDRQYRALGDLYNLRSQWKERSVRLLDIVSPKDMEDLNISHDLETAFPSHLVCVLPGVPFYHHKHEVLCIKCKDGWVAFRRVTARKTMSAKAFYNGHLSRRGAHATMFLSQRNDLDKYTFRTVAAQVSLQAAATNRA